MISSAENISCCVIYSPIVSHSTGKWPMYLLNRLATECQGVAVQFLAETPELLE